MARLLSPRCVLAVRDLRVSTRYYLDVLGFVRDPIEAAGWSFLSHGDFRVMLGECPGERPANEIGNHSYFAWVGIEGVDEYHGEVRSRGAEIFLRLADKPWKMREFGVRTIDGHRVVFGEWIGGKTE
jgi:hypothetical protein